MVDLERHDLARVRPFEVLVILLAVLVAGTAGRCGVGLGGGLLLGRLPGPRGAGEGDLAPGVVAAAPGAAGALHRCRRPPRRPGSAESATPVGAQERRKGGPAKGLALSVRWILGRPGAGEALRVGVRGVGAVQSAGA